MACYVFVDLLFSVSDPCTCYLFLFPYKNYFIQLLIIFYFTGMEGVFVLFSLVYIIS